MVSNSDNPYIEYSDESLRKAYWGHVDESESLIQEGKEPGEEHDKSGTQILDAISAIIGPGGSIIEFIRAGRGDLAKKVDEIPQEENEIIRELSPLERFFEGVKKVVHNTGEAKIESSYDTRYDGGSGYTVIGTFRLKVAGKITDSIDDWRHYDDRKELQELQGDIREAVVGGVKPYLVEQRGENFIIHEK